MRETWKEQAEVFGRVLARLRSRAGLSQYRLSKLSGVSTQSISILEKGKTMPSWEAVRLLAKALGVSVAEFDVEEEVGVGKALLEALEGGG